MTTFADAAQIADRERERAAGIVELCVLSGRASEAAGFIRSALDVGSVQLRLAREATAGHPVDQPVPQQPHARPPQPGRQQPPAGNGAGFDLAAIERVIAEKRTLQ